MDDDAGGAEEGLEAVVIDMDVSPEANLRFDGVGRSVVRARLVEDVVDHEAAGPGDAGDDLGEVRGAPRGQWPRGGGFEADGVVPATVAAGDELIDEAPPIGDVAKSREPRRISAWSSAVLRWPWWDSTAPFSCASPGSQRLASIPLRAELVVAAGHVLGGLVVKVAIRGGEPVGAVFVRHAAEIPERVLEVLGQRGEAR